MILTNRKFVREAPSRVSKSIFIFCEGAKREYQYFMFFKEMDSRINVEIHKLNHNDNNSPLGLLDIAKENVVAAETNITNLQKELSSIELQVRGQHTLAGGCILFSSFQLLTISTKEDPNWSPSKS